MTPITTAIFYGISEKMHHERRKSSKIVHILVRRVRIIQCMRTKFFQWRNG